MARWWHHFLEAIGTKPRSHFFHNIHHILDCSWILVGNWWSVFFSIWSRIHRSCLENGPPWMLRKLPCCICPSVPRSRTAEMVLLIPMKIRKPFWSFLFERFHEFVGWIRPNNARTLGDFDAVTVRRFTDGNSSEVSMCNTPKVGRKLRGHSGQDQTYLKTSQKLV